MSRLYNPTIGGILRSTRTARENPEENAKNLLWYGVKYFDEALYGIDMNRGELIGVQAMEKNRKTTWMLNIAYNLIHQLMRYDDIWFSWDTLESGMPPQALADSILAIAATRIIICDIFGPDPTKWPPIETIKAHPELKNELIISKEFIWYGVRTKRQQDALTLAEQRLESLPMSIFGAPPQMGSSRELKSTLSRWDLLYKGAFPGLEGKAHRIFVVDHIQQYAGFGSKKFDQLESVISDLSNFVVTHPNTILFCISQVSLTSHRAGEAYAKGGAALAAEANVLIETRYDQDSDPYHIIVKVPAARKKAPPTIIQPIEPESGAFVGEARPAKAI